MNGRGAAALTAALCTALGACAWPPLRSSSPERLLEPAAAEELAEGRPFLPPLELTADPTEDAVVRVVGGVACSGVLIDDDLVLTAHHCVAKRDRRGRVLREDLPADHFSVELGGDDLPWAEVGVRAIVSPNCGYASGDGDIAILVLDRKLVGMAYRDVRLHAPPELGEPVMPWGYGRCAASRGAIRRVQREGRDVSAVTSGQFVADAAICPGDSGGPVFGPRGDVVGVVSASVMDAHERTLGASQFSRVDVWPALFSAAREIANGHTPSELPPFRRCGR